MWIHLKHRCVVQVSGPDVKSFLQGLITQDVLKLTPGGCLYSLMLTPQGRFLYDLFLCEWEGNLYLLPEKETVEAFIRTLTMYTLGRPIVIREVPQMVVASDLSGALMSPPSGKGLVVNDPRRPSMGRLYLGNIDSFPELVDDGNAYLAHRIACCVSEGPHDLIPHKSIPLANRMDEMGAIDWDKGCYIGQELTARTKHLGEIRKNIFTVVAESIIEDGEQALYTLENDKKLAGTLRSRFLKTGLAQIRLEYIKQPVSKFRLSCETIVAVSFP